MSLINDLNDKTVLIKPEFHITTGKKKLLVSDLRLADGSELPPEAIASLGHKKVIDPEDLKPLIKCRDKVDAILRNAGIKFVGATLTTTDKADEIVPQIVEIVREFDAERQNFLDNYDTKVEQWIAQNPSWDNIIRDAVPTKRSVATRISADVNVFNLTPTSYVPERLEEKAKGLGDVLYEDVAQAASTFLNESVYDSSKGNKGKAITRADGVTQKALRPIRTMREKLASLAFIDSSIKPVVDLIDDVLGRMPKRGRIEASSYRDLLSLTLILSNTNSMKGLASGLTTFGPEPDITSDTSDYFDDEWSPAIVQPPAATASVAAKPAADDWF